MRPWCEGYTDCRLPVQAQASQGHSCDLHTDVDYSGHDMIFGRGLHSFPFQLNLSSSVHRMTQIDS